jgi:hypothetical protein
MKPKHWEIVKRLHSKFVSSCEQFIVTGSIALSLHGLVDSDEIKDVDIVVVKPSQEMLKELALMQQLAPVRGRSIYPPNLNAKQYCFELVDSNCKPVVVDVFIDDERSILWYDFVSVSSLMNIIEAKRKYCRVKDLQFFSKLASRILIGNTEIKDQTKI